MSLISVKSLTFAYDGSFGNVFDNVSFQFDTDWKIGFIGRNGRGKTTFLRLLMGAYEYRGTISSTVQFQYFPFRVADTSRITQDVLSSICPSAEEWQMLREISLLEMTSDALRRPFVTLSGGERTKALLAALFLNESQFLLIDEPTNHLDALARVAVGRYLRQKRGFLLVSHDRALLDDCVDHVLSVNKTDIEVQSGNFSSWYRNKQLRDGFEIAESEKLKKEIKRLESAARRSSAWADKVESAKMGKGAAATRKKGHANIDTMAYNARNPGGCSNSEKTWNEGSDPQSRKSPPYSGTSRPPRI